ncbi:MAG: GTPase [Phycisphaerae bacterium]
MPANLTPDYERAEQRYRQAVGDDEKLDALREMLATVPKHKGTEKIQADLKRRISQLRKAAAHKASAKGLDLFHVPKGGAGQVVLVGLPNCGKSMIVAATTNAPVKVADYPYTTAVPAPGMWRYEDVQIQLVDTPPLTAEHVPPGLMGTINYADVLCLVVDGAAGPLEQAETLTAIMSARGLVLRSVPRAELDHEDFSQHSAILVVNKVDLASREDVAALGDLYAGRLDVLGVSAVSGEGLDELARRLWRLLAVIRVYTKEPGRAPDHARPFTLELGSTVEDLARLIHRELPEKMKFARIWGDGRFSGQQVHRTEALKDKDVVEIHQ